LIELLEYALLFLRRNAGTVSVTLTVKWPFAALAVMRTSPASVNWLLAHQAPSTRTAGSEKVRSKTEGEHSAVIAV
jgi:hypothetical protein